MKIIIPLIGSFGKAGGFRVLSQLANYWIMDGHDVVFLSYINGTDPYFPTKAKVLYYDNKGGISTQKDNNHPKPFLGMFQLRKALTKALNQFEADIVLANHCFSAQPVKKSSIEARKFYYVQAYEPDYYYHKTIKDFIFKKISENSYKLGLEIIVNASMYRDYKEIKTDKVIFPGLDLDVFKPQTISRDSNKIILGTIGRLEEYKGTIYIIEAFKMLRKKLGEKIELHIGFGEKHLEEIEGIKVFFPNGDKELAQYYNSLNFYICAGTIQMEAIHYPIIESMACKVPVITTGYYPSNHDNSIMIPIKDSIALEKAVIKAIDEKEVVESKKEKAFTSIEQFDWKIISRKMINYFS
ncbi:glycosyltransferase family 4 protein [Chryseobacterium rhizoplanae]|uniref:glycosyltransferase family 4 protein n=1 Tax=Chryseobacterium rhizoplanae TaxID=1609531 RepID=UPI001CE2E0F9|nr:glycosyltransferase family 4 protein [Chryseobacterium rhizoplanae]UCA61903.1 glycosyltransferase family 4 protein [Chryseobacterium rhizoplanae]